jgi:hypothetical protein
MLSPVVTRLVGHPDVTQDEVVNMSGWWGMEHGWIMTFHSYWEWNNHPN